ncbi:PP1-complex regulatory subunit GLC8 [Kluyveromyces lactis]|uniref:KLLA0F03080p n=1 Tax=Kluyveromyces lactis (strain ATCC 8585 / CBS 2359 / DSM 70799 / NBRC 1267 / NRRL Y-1140 / WM37) TaxID=284590 RepID=Q6CLH0_KLULA|nr:uncharacterized protein KLLA0_F03080g [Kluyveromyces lactis]CAG97927.1 KLLA0F03080p [Kluyveromyces lactis]|eukprot:XP_455219.1 uncharacterized protein KLLA0_F03080g [Kluyveromyces lactis]
MGGILKNAIPEEQSPNIESESISQFRKQVLKNTELNAKRTSNSKIAHHGHGIPKDVLSMKLGEQDPESLKWNKKNLEENEITKQEFGDIHIDEPKTPYQGAVDPNGEYYKIDDDDEDLGGFSLGEPQVDLKEDKEPVTLLNNEDPQVSPPVLETEEDEAAKKHRKFEEMRKKHYNVKADLQNAKQNLPDDDDDE